MSVDEKIIPFGKLRGRPIEELKHHTQYLQWLQAQPWFREKFGWIVEELYGRELPEQQTPVHNAMQAKFLDKGYALRLFRRLVGEGLVERHIERMEDGLQKSQDPIDQQKYRDELSELRTRPETLEDRIRVRFEKSNVDVSILYPCTHYSSCRCRWLEVELKPTLADEYPVVLRKILKRADMNARLNYQRGIEQAAIQAVVVGHYHGVGATWDQVKEIFAKSFVHIFLLSEIEP